MSERREDPIVAEVRRVRKELEEQQGSSFEGIFRAALETQRQFKGEVVVAEPRLVLILNKRKR
jgi:hypothetical protein